jgi:hypothetical protein
MAHLANEERRTKNEERTKRVARVRIESAWRQHGVEFNTHVSVQIAHDHMATAFHFLIWNREFALEVEGLAGLTTSWEK